MMQTGIIYRHPEKVSAKARLLQKAMVMTRRREKIEKRFRRGKFLHKPDKIPRAVRRAIEIQESVVAKQKLYTFTPTSVEPAGIILYFHGGAYVRNFTKYHWELIAAIATATACRVIAPDYPLAPDNQSDEMYSYLADLQPYLESLANSSPITIMGDSAGGGLALAYSQWLEARQCKIINQIILLSPWLDLSMSNPAIYGVTHRDKMLSVRGLLMAGSSYANELLLQDYRISPLFGEYGSLPSISLFIGTNDLFWPDCLKLKDICLRTAQPFNYFEYPSMFHVWISVITLRESKAAIRQIGALLNN
jgi:acetyl esterase/lipase